MCHSQNMTPIPAITSKSIVQMCTLMKWISIREFTRLLLSTWLDYILWFQFTHRLCVNFSKFAAQKWKCRMKDEFKYVNLVWTNSETVIKNEINRFSLDDGDDDEFWLSLGLHFVDFIEFLCCSHLMRANSCDIASGRWHHVDSSMRCAKSENVWKLYRNICIWYDWLAEMKFGKCRVFKCNFGFSSLLSLLLLLEVNSMMSLSGNSCFRVSFSGKMYPIACCWLQSSIFPVSLVSTMKIDTFPSLLHSILPQIM